MAGRITQQRENLVKYLKECGSRHDWSHITSQIGMFALTALVFLIYDCIMNSGVDVRRKSLGKRLGLVSHAIIQPRDVAKQYTKSEKISIVLKRFFEPAKIQSMVR